MSLDSKRLVEAFAFAVDLHKNQLRKGTKISYISHLMAVSALVLEAGGDTDQTIAALLHDAVEDQGGLKVLVEIKERFGERVGNIVEGCSDSFTQPKPPWKMRKEEYLAHLPVSSPDIRHVSLADKLHNARSILQDLKTHGTEVFNKFNGGQEGTLWYYSQLVDIFKQTDSGFLSDELNSVVKQIKKIASEDG